VRGFDRSGRIWPKLSNLRRCTCVGLTDPAETHAWPDLWPEYRESLSDGFFFVFWVSIVFVGRIFVCLLGFDCVCRTDLCLFFGFGLCLLDGSLFVFWVWIVIAAPALLSFP
jgi:hypothetical protein